MDDKIYIANKNGRAVIAKYNKHLDVHNFSYVSKFTSFLVSNESYTIYTNNQYRYLLCNIFVRVTVVKVPLVAHFAVSLLTNFYLQSID